MRKIALAAVILLTAGSTAYADDRSMCEAGGGTWIRDVCEGFHADRLPPMFNQHETSEESQSQTLTLCTLPMNNTATLVFNSVLNCWEPRGE